MSAAAATRGPAPPPLAVAGAGVIVAVAVTVLVFVFGHVVNGTGDSTAVISGTHFELKCLGNGTLTACGGQVAPYPLLQYLPTAVMIGLGVGDAEILRMFGIISAFAFAGMLILGWLVMRRLGRPALAAALVLVLIVSPLPWYAWATFGESLGAFVCMAFVAAALLRAPAAVLALTLLLAGQTKETALPFMLLLGIGALLWTPVVGRTLGRRHWVGLAIGAVLSLVGTGGFNQLRFGQFTNLIYADPMAHTQTFALKVKFAGSIWLAPNAGLAVFWPTCAIVFLAVLLIGLRRLRAPRDRHRTRILGASIIVILCLAGLTAGYASWYAPFGWIAWGPRLMLLTVPALVLFSAATLAPELERLLRARGRRAAVAFTVVGALTLISWIPQLGAMFAPTTMGSLFAPDAVCPVQQPVGQDPGYYYTCIFHWAWWKHWILPDAFRGIWSSGAALRSATIWLVAVVVLMAGALRLVRPEDATLAEAPVDGTPTETGPAVT